MTDINKPVNLNEMIKSIIMRIKLIRCIELKAIVTLSLVLINSGNLLIGSNLFIRDNNDLSADTILRYNHYPTGKLYVYYSKDQTNQSSPAVIFFFGGGWNSGSPKQFESQASYLNKYGVTVVLADYRTQKNAGTTPKEALMDAKSAMRYLKQQQCPYMLILIKYWQAVALQVDIWLLQQLFVIKLIIRRMILMCHQFLKL